MARPCLSHLIIRVWAALCWVLWRLDQPMCQDVLNSSGAQLLTFQWPHWRAVGWGGPSHLLLSSEPLLTFNSHLCSCLKLLIKTQSASWIPHSLPKDGEASVATEMAQLELFGRGRWQGGWLPWVLHSPHTLGQGVWMWQERGVVTGEGSGLRRKS